MRNSLRRSRRSRALWFAAGALALAAVAGGCAAGEEGGGGAVATIYVSAPLSGPAGADGQDVRDGVLLALSDAGGKISGGSVEGVEAGGVEVDTIFADDASGDQRFDPVKTAENARSASEDSTALAYIGELDSGATQTSLPITNNAGILQVSPGSGAGNLVRKDPFDNDLPIEFQTTGKRTFARLVPSDEDQGATAADWVDKAMGGPAMVIDDGSNFGDELTDGFESGRQGAGPVGGVPKNVTGCQRSAAQARQVADIGKPTGPGPTGGRPVTNPVVFLAAEPRCAMDALEVLGAAGARVRLLGSDAMISQVGLKTMHSVDIGAIVTAAAPKPADLPAKGREFARSFRAQFDRDPGRYAAYGYEAMDSILAAIDRSDDPADRDSLIDAYFDGTKRDSVIGRYAIDETGEPNGLGVSLYAADPDGTLGVTPERPGPKVPEG